MIISDYSYSKKIIINEDKEFVEILEIIDLTHPDCPLVKIDEFREFLSEENNDNQ